MIIILIVVAVYWLIFSLLAYSQVNKVFAFFRKQPSIEIKEEWKGFINDSVDKWDEKSIIIGCFIRFPYNFTLLGLILISFMVLIPLSKYFGQKGR